MMRVLSLFSGIGGFDLGLEATGAFETVAACDINPYSRAVFVRHWPHVKQYSDVRTLTAATLAGDGITVDAICAGFPCQDLSLAGKRAGIEGARSGLWSEVARLVGELQPRVVLLENVPGILSAGLGRVLGDLAALGYDAVWDCIPASAIGAPHRRDRWMCIAFPSAQAWPDSQADPQRADANRQRPHRAALHVAQTAKLCNQQECVAKSVGQILADTNAARRQECHVAAFTAEPRPFAWCIDAAGGFWSTEPNVGRVADGVPNRVDRLTALGNAIVPQWAYLAGVWAIAILNEQGARP